MCVGGSWGVMETWIKCGGQWRGERGKAFAFRSTNGTHFGVSSLTSHHVCSSKSDITPEPYCSFSLANHEDREELLFLLHSHKLQHVSWTFGKAYRGSPAKVKAEADTLISSLTTVPVSTRKKSPLLAPHPLQHACWDGAKNPILSSITLRLPFSSSPSSPTGPS